MRGIGVAVITSTSTRFALLRQRKPLVHAEAMLLVDDREREIAERDLLLEQRMGADERDRSRRRRGRASISRALAAASRGRSGSRRACPAASASGAMVVEMLARQDFGRRHQRGLAAGLVTARGGEQRHHGLAGADVALQQPQHALGLGQIGDDLGDGARLRGR